PPRPKASLLNSFSLLFLPLIMQTLQVPFKAQTSRSLISLTLISSSICIIYLYLSIILLPRTKLLDSSASLQEISYPTSLQHIVFGIGSNRKTWPLRKNYVQLWWRTNQMRGCVFLESMPPSDGNSHYDADSLPPLCVSEDTSRFRYSFRGAGGLQSAIRVARVVMETVALNHSNVRWFVFGDDDTIFFPENLAKVLSKYDHDLWYYIGTNSESYMQNKLFSFDMAFGGAGFAMSYPLAKVLAKVFDSCIERYPHLYGSDGRISSCIQELGIGLTRESGFHQMDLRGDIFGLLAAHPVTPLISLHHLDIAEPIFPSMTKLKGLKHLFEAATFDSNRILQQTVCYDTRFKWTISVSWGYAVQVFSNHLFLRDAVQPEATFRPWKGGNAFDALFNFNLREHQRDPCRRSTVFFFDKVSGSQANGIISTYRRLVFDNCTFDVASPRILKEIRVFSQKLDLNAKQVMNIGVRECKEEELIYMHS
ncbi:hypothetical protein RJ640_026783, partial [Escallonia rubra]